MNTHNTSYYRDPGFLISSAVILLSVCFVLPGLFDTTLTSRLAIYPVLAGVLLFAGRDSIPAYYFYAGITISAVPLISLLWTPIPVQSIVPCMRWLSFGMMIAGCAGIVNKYGIDSIFRGIIIGAVAAAFLLWVMSNDLPAGNPNRLGPLFVAGLLAVITGAGFKDKFIRLPAGTIMAVGLYLTHFYTAVVALVLGILWFLISKKQKINPAFMLFFLLTGQIFITASPDIAGKAFPTLELRSRTWTAGLAQLEKTLPWGTGAGQSRLTLIQDAGDEAQLLVGDPDTRIDFLHSEFLTPIVEMGVLGFAALLLAGWFFLKRNFAPVSGAFFVCILPFLLIDLPLASPLGAMPIAFCLVLSMDGFRKGRVINISPAVPVILLGLSIFWAGAVIHGYHLMDKGRKIAIVGDPAEASELFASAVKFIPFEERNYIYLGESRMQQNAVLASYDAYCTFNSIYPGYWRGWVAQAEVESNLGRMQDAAGSWITALRMAPVTLDERCIFAVNAAAVIPDNMEDVLLIANSVHGLCYFLAPDDSEFAEIWAERLAGVAEMLIVTNADIAGDVLMEAGNCLSAVTSSNPATLTTLRMLADELSNRKLINFLLEPGFRISPQNFDY